MLNITHQGLGDSEDESYAKIFPVPESETGQKSAPHNRLKLMPRKPQQGSADRVLVENKIDTTSVTWRSKYNCNVQVHNYNFSRWLKLESFLNFLTEEPENSGLEIEVEYPSFSGLVCFPFKFFIQVSLQTVCMPCDFPLAVVFAAWACHMNIRSFCRIKKLSPNFHYTGVPNSIIPFMLVGYEIGYSQPGPTGLVGYNIYHLISNARPWNTC